MIWPSVGAIDVTVPRVKEAIPVNRQQQQARDRAVQLLQHYVQVLFDKSGHSASYTGDTAAELEQLVDGIIAAATPAVTDATEHVEAVAAEQARQRTERVDGGAKP